MYKTLILAVITTFFIIGCGDDNSTKTKDPCEGITCSNLGTCYAVDGEALCNCISGYHAEGLSCVTDSDACENVTCSNHGNCVVSNDNPICICENGFHAEGTECIEDSDPCEGVACSGHGSCAVSGNSPICVCETGYHSEGLNCIENLDSCDGIDCSGNGTCVLSGNSAICICDNGYHAVDLTCIEDVDPCEGVTCSNHGVCATSGGDAICVCNSGYVADGLSCVEQTNPCDGVTCSSHGNCLVSGDSAVCICDNGYYADGLNCEEENPCEGVVCEEWEICIEGDCDLKEGRCERNGDCTGELICDSNNNCVDPVSPCEGVTCSGNGVCADTDGTAVCICSDGYIADGLSCISETDPCEGVTCSNAGICAVSGDSPVCICNSGYHTEGLNCIADLDPCEGVTCSNAGYCVESGGAPLCICNSGYHVEGTECIEDVDPCEGVTCSGNGNCAISGGEAICVCNSGYHSEGLTCVEDVDSCDGVTCSGFGNCVVSGDSAVCICNDGYHAEGLSCVEDVDPCAGITCSGHGTCIASGDQPICFCDSGYSEDGTECVQDITIGELFITEFMANPDIVSDTDGEWIEIYNSGTRVLDLSNLTIVKDTTTTPLTGDNLTIAPGEYFVIAKSENSLVPYDVVASFSSLGNTGSTFSIVNNGRTLHEITYPSALQGKSWQLSSVEYSSYNDFTKWCAGSGVISGDNSDLGTPGTANIECVADLCDGVDCNQGQCLADEVEYICVCNTGYTGDFCDQCLDGFHQEGELCVEDADLCDGVNCNNGQCLSYEDDYVCVCDTGYIGDYCDSCDTGYVDDGSGNCILDSSQDLNEGDVIITEIMANPASVLDSVGEWVEIYNNTSNEIFLVNFKIVKDTTSYSLVESGLSIQPNSYFVIANSTSANLPQVDAVISNLSLTNSGTHSVSIEIDGFTLDSIASYGAESGKSWQKDPSDSWCNGTSVISGDNSDLGTPGTGNSVCSTDLCEGVDCNHGECMSDEIENIYVCICDTGYTGDYCDSCDTGYVDDGSGNCVLDSTDLCEGVDCNHGECMSDEIENIYVCICDTGYTGDYCDSCDTGYVDDGSGNCILDQSQVINEGDIIITEFMANPEGTDTGNEWIEIYNTTDHDIDIQNITIENIGSSTRNFTITGGNTVVSSNGYIIVAPEGLNFGDIPHAYSDVEMYNSMSTLELFDGTTSIDAILYEDSPVSGESFQLDPNSFNHNDNDTWSNWCRDVGGTPGTINNYCNPTPLTIEWCNVQYPTSINATVGDNTNIVYGQVYVAGITDQHETAHPLVVAQMGYTYQLFGTSYPVVEGDYYWEDAQFNVKSNNNHEYMTSFPTSEAEDFYYIYRFSGDGGSTWTYCDLSGVIESSTINAGEAYITE